MRIRGNQMRAAFVAAIVLSATAVSAQGRISNAKTETRPAAQGLAREVQNVAARGVAAWIGYRAPMVSGPRQMCCYDTISTDGACCGRCRLEGGSGVTMSQSESRVSLEPPSESRSSPRRFSDRTSRSVGRR